MRYMLMIHLNDDADSQLENDPALFSRVMGEHDKLQAELRASGEFVETHELLPTDSKIVRTRANEVLVTDGPFTESKEWIAGYYVVDCASVERAAEIAGRLAESELSLVEVRTIR
ncbi:MAG TPA: YciI family protein [Galbitalea sp.]|jgi:hypothetical protein